MQYNFDFFLLPYTPCSPPPPTLPHSDLKISFKVLRIRSPWALAKCIFLAFAKCFLAMPTSHQSALSGCGPERQIPGLDTFYVASHFLPCPPFVSKLTPCHPALRGEGLPGHLAQMLIVPLSFAQPQRCRQISVSFPR